MKKINKFIIKIACFFVITLNLFAANITEIKIEGNNRISDETIKVYGDIKLNENVDEKKINQILNNLYSTDFFEDVIINQKNGVLNIKVKEYPIVNQLIIKGEKRNSLIEEIKKQISTKEKKSFIKSSLSKDISLIKNLYSSVENIDTKVKELDSSNYDILIEIDRGELTKFHL